MVGPGRNAWEPHLEGCAEHQEGQGFARANTHRQKAAPVEQDLTHRNGLLWEQAAGASGAAKDRAELIREGLAQRKMEENRGAIREGLALLKRPGPSGYRAYAVELRGRHDGATLTEGGLGHSFWPNNSTTAS